MPCLGLRVIALALFASLLMLDAASAHCVVGNRVFQATLNVDDPCVADELPINRDSGSNIGVVAQRATTTDTSLINPRSERL